MPKYFVCIRNARLLACNADEEMSGIAEKVIAGMCFWILNQSVHRINCPCME